MKENLLSKEIQNITFSRDGGTEWTMNITLFDGRQIKKARVSTPASVNSLLETLVPDISILSDTKENDNAPSYIIRMKYILDNEYSEPITLSQLEARLNVSQYRLCREFGQYIGSSPIQYLKTVRLDAAAHLLLTTDLKVYEICNNVGYENTNHFINQFKDQFNCTPLKYRSSH